MIISGVFVDERNLKMCGGIIVWSFNLSSSKLDCWKNFTFTLLNNCHFYNYNVHLSHYVTDAHRRKGEKNRNKGSVEAKQCVYNFDDKTPILNVKGTNGAVFTREINYASSDMCPFNDLGRR